MTFSSKLDLLRSRRDYQDRGVAITRWGQLLREGPEVRNLLDSAREAGRLVPLRDLVSFRGGVVTRANAYFIVRELPFDQIPRRFGVTRADYRRIAVVMDGLEVPFKIERKYLRPIIKGPESLVSPTTVELTDARLFVVEDDKAALRAARANGALQYLKRGETVAYNVSEDSLKGGIPAERSNIKGRKPYWYSLSVPPVSKPRLIVPEHIDTRQIATLVPPDNAAVVIDKLYAAEPHDPADAGIILASLNSLLTWYQVELRGRTQLGQGVLELKVPDWLGILILNPADLTPTQKAGLMRLFGHVARLETSDSVASVGEPARVAFDTAYLDLTGSRSAADDRITVEREWRALLSERHERRESVAEAKLERRKVTNVAASVDAYAARIVARLAPCPDPRSFLKGKTSIRPMPVQGPVSGVITIGTELFNQGQVLASSVVIADAGDMLSAQFVKGVLLQDPTLTQVDVPVEAVAAEIMSKWRDAVREWRKRFDAVAVESMRGIQDPRMRDAILRRALQLCHAE
jgi:hypothetical protein